MIMLALSYGHASAATCISGAGLGTVNITVPELSAKGTYNIWSRVQVPDDMHNRYQLEVNNDKCFLVGGSSIIASQWTWVSFQDGDLSSKVRYDFNTTTGNSLKLIGKDDGVKVDRVLIVKNDCIPIDQGANCQTDAVAAASYDTSDQSRLLPSTSGPVSGVVIPSTTIINKLGSISNVSYFADSKPFPTTSNYGLNTTLLSNGSHQISIKITTVDGTVINESTTIIANNPQTIFSPYMRWEQLNHQTVLNIGAVAIAVILVGILVSIIRYLRLRRRSLRFHGF